MTTNIILATLQRLEGQALTDSTLSTNKTELNAFYSGKAMAYQTALELLGHALQTSTPTIIDAIEVVFDFMEQLNKTERDHGHSDHAAYGHALIRETREYIEDGCPDLTALDRNIELGEEAAVKPQTMEL